MLSRHDWGPHACYLSIEYYYIYRVVVRNPDVSEKPPKRLPRAQQVNKEAERDGDANIVELENAFQYVASDSPHFKVTAPDPV